MNSKAFLLLAIVVASFVAMCSADSPGKDLGPISCADTNGALGSDCRKLFNRYKKDMTKQNPDSHGRVGISVGSCLATINYEKHAPIYTNANLVQYGRRVYKDCFPNPRIYKSGTARTGTGAKFCLTNNHSGGSC